MKNLSYAIKAQNLSKYFKDTPILDNLNLEVMKGEHLVLLGKNGCGKTTLLKCISGLIALDDGDILIKGVNTSRLSAFDQQKYLAPFGMLFQQGALFDSLTVIENISFGLIYGLQINKKRALDIAMEKLSLVKLGANIASLYPAELSGGMKRRVALARAISNTPDLVFFDNPAAGLDPILARIIEDLIGSYLKEKNATAITVTHDIQSVRRIADRVALMHKGKIFWVGTVQEMDRTKNLYVQQFINGLPVGPLQE